MAAEKMKNGQNIPAVTEAEKISIKLIDDFPNHPYYVFDDEDMFELTESIRKNGLIFPLVVRKKENRFELISGHRRKHACELLGHAEIACNIVDVTDDEAIIMMVDSNCQRTKVLPSERAFAYKMKLDATTADSLRLPCAISSKKSESRPQRFGSMQITYYSFCVPRNLRENAPADKRAAGAFFIRRTTTGSASGEKSFSYGQNKNSLIYLKLRFANPTKIYQGGPNHEREGHK